MKIRNLLNLAGLGLVLFLSSCAEMALNRQNAEKQKAYATGQLSKEDFEKWNTYYTRESARHQLAYELGAGLVPSDKLLDEWEASGRNTVAVRQMIGLPPVIQTNGGPPPPGYYVPGSAPEMRYVVTKPHKPKGGYVSPPPPMKYVVNKRPQTNSGAYIPQPSPTYVVTPREPKPEVAYTPPPPMRYEVTPRQKPQEVPYQPAPEMRYEVTPRPQPQYTAPEVANYVPAPQMRYEVTPRPKSQQGTFPMAESPRYVPTPTATKNKLSQTSQSSPIPNGGIANPADHLPGFVEAEKNRLSNGLGKIGISKGTSDKIHDGLSRLGAEIVKDEMMGGIGGKIIGTKAPARVKEEIGTAVVDAVKPQETQPEPQQKKGFFQKLFGR